MAYLVTSAFNDANHINKLFLRMWAQSLKDDGYGLNDSGDPATGIRGGEHVKAVTTDWFIPKQTLGGNWAVLIPSESDAPAFKAPVNRSFSEMEPVAGISLDFNAFKAALGLGADVPKSGQLGITLEQWGTAALIASGITYEIVADSDIQWKEE